MELLYSISRYVVLVVYLATVIVAFTWMPRRGKWLLCTAMLITVLNVARAAIVDSSFERGLLEWSETTYQITSFIGLLLSHASAVLLLLFVIVARKTPRSAAAFGTGGPTIPAEAADPELTGIGGWLILPAIGLVVSIIASVVGLILSFSVFEEMSDRGCGGYMALSVGVQIIMMVFILVATVRFFGKTRSAPATMIALMIANMAFSLLLTFAAFGTREEDFAIAEIRGFVMSLIASAIWIPYFAKSKRVKATFVNGPAANPDTGVSPEIEAGV